MDPDGYCVVDRPAPSVRDSADSTGREPDRTRLIRWNPAGQTDARYARGEGESVYSLHKLLWDIRRDKALKDRYLADPDAILDNYGIDGDWRDLMKGLDFKSMYERGINPYLLYFCAIQLEVDRADYYAQIRGEKN